MQHRTDEILSAWGPYSKKYMGISHVPDVPSLTGARFDCVVFPTIANSGVPVPNVTVPSGYHPWNAAGDLSFIEYRCELEWKDRLYADVSFSQAAPDAVVIRTAFVNRTALSQNCMINYFCAMEYPDPSVCTAKLPGKSLLWDAADYESYRYASPRPWDGQNPDGAKKGVFPEPAFTGGFGLGDRVSAHHLPQLRFFPFGMEKGDVVRYRVRCDTAFEDAVLGVRYRTRGAAGRPQGHLDLGRQTAELAAAPAAQGPACAFEAGGILTGRLELPGAGEPAVAFFPVGSVAPGELELSLTAAGSACGVEIDCFFLLEKGREGAAAFPERRRNTVPQIACEDGAYLYRYEGIEENYGLLPLGGRIRTRTLATGSLEDALISRLSNPDPTFDDVTEPFTRSFARKHTNDGFYHNTMSHSIYIGPGETHVEYAVVFRGRPVRLAPEECERVYRARRAPESLGFTQAGKPYEQSVRLLRSTLLGNIVYPIYRHGENIRHFTPGKRWDSLYTWDSGFIGLGLLESEPRLAEYVLDTYLSEPGNPDFAFLFHGSPVPVQIYLYLEMLNRENGKDRLLAYYPRLRLYYEFLVGRTHGSTTARFKSGLTSTYDLFYSSSGMDDYPAQLYLHEHGLERTAAPCISTSHAIRFAKILRMAAARGGHQEDLPVYDADIARMTQALQTCAWDDESGYFGYVLHDEALEPKGIMRSETGENLDKGFDGLYPLVAGACTPAQRQRLLAHLESEKEIFSPVGLSAVDRTAGYYQDNGYWNGCVWFAHQWFFYKTMLDLGRADTACKIAETALKVWKREVDDSYNCFEMIQIATGRGGWYHQFGGLSAPVSVWASAYFKPGTVTAGFETWIDRREFSPDASVCRIDFARAGDGDSSTLIAVLGGRRKTPLRALCNGRPVPVKERLPGVAEVTLGPDCRGGTLEIG